MKGLTEQQELFLQEYIKDMPRNAKRAAIAAGYSAKGADQSASRLLSQAKIKARLAELTRDQVERNKLCADEVISGLREVKDRCLQAEPVMEKGPDGKLVPSGEWKFDSAGANKALQLLGMYLAMFTDKKEVNGKVTLETFLGGTWPDDDKKK